MKNLVIDGKFKVKMKTSWEELTLEDFYRLELWRETKEQDLIRALAIISDLPYEIWNKSSYGDFKHIVLPAMVWMSDTPKLRRIRMKDEIKIMDKLIKIPKNAEYETLGQKVAIDQKIAKYAEQYADSPTCAAFYQMSYAMAVYVSPLISEKDFDIEHSEIVQLEIQGMPFFEVYPICSFFLKKYAASTKWSVLSQSRNLMKRKGWSILQNLKNLVSSRRGTHSQKETSQSTMKY